MLDEGGGKRIHKNLIWINEKLQNNVLGKKSEISKNDAILVALWLFCMQGEKNQHIGDTHVTAHQMLFVLRWK